MPDHCHPDRRHPVRRLASAALLSVSLLSAVLAVGGCGGPDPCGGRYEPSVVHEEIDAAAGLSHEPSRAFSLARIADRSRLRPDEQAHLASAAFRDLKFDPSRLAVLLKLIGNPSFAPRAKVCILRSLDRLDYEPSRIALIEAMKGRGDEEPGRADEDDFRPPAR
jgi:hypothetical protein